MTDSIPSTTATLAEPADPIDQAPEKLSLFARLATLTAITLPFAGVVAAFILLWGWGFSWTHLGILVVMYVLTALGITVGFHRLFTHRAFETNRVVQFILAALGSMAIQGSLNKWVAQHRLHHRFSDTPGDPHSPHLHGRGVLGVLRGFWHAHIGWAFRPDPVNLDHYAKDIDKNPLLRVSSRMFPVWVVVGLLIPTILGGVLTLSWSGALLGLIWGGLVRVFLVHHVTWSVNSICHLWGSKTHPAGDHSRNNFLFGVLAMGEGWHNNHHAFPTSARHGLSWWQIDFSWYVIRMMAMLGLAWKIKLPANRH